MNPNHILPEGSLFNQPHPDHVASWNEDHILNPSGHPFHSHPKTSHFEKSPIFKRPVKVVHIITGLNLGGAEVMLRELLRYSAPDFEHEVISLSDIGPIGRSMQELGVNVSALNLRMNLAGLSDLARLTKQVKRARPDVVQTWLYHADILGGIAARLAGVSDLVWGLHMSHLDPHNTKKSTLLMLRLGSLLSRALPRVIVCCANSTCRLHVKQGYAANKMRVIFNGFDLDRFKPNPKARTRLRQEWGVSEEAPIIGLIGRFHPQKDHANFVLAAQLAATSHPDAYFLLCGSDCDENNSALLQLIGNSDLKRRFLLLGRREDTADIMAALDIVTLSSAYGEAFPMVIGEAMACAVPVVVTNLGDCAFLVGTCGRVVPPRNASVLARAWSELLYLSPARRARWGERGRARIQQQFSIQQASAHYHELYRDLAHDPRKVRQRMWKHAL